MEERQPFFSESTKEQRKLSSAWHYLPSVFKGLFFVWFLGTIAAVIALIFVSIHLNTVQKDLMSNNNAVQGSCPHSLQDILTNTKGLFRENRQHLLQYFADQNIHSGVIYMTGKLTEYRNTDVEYLFRQESHYQYVTGVNFPGTAVVIDISSKNCTLFVPRPTAQYGVWNGLIQSLEQQREQYDVDEVQYIDNVTDYLAPLRATNEQMFVLSDSVVIPGNNSLNFTLNTSALTATLTSARQAKTPKEIVLMQYVATVSSEAHKSLMLNVRPTMWEYELESLFLYNVSFCGLRQPAYLSIVGSGVNSAILHYSANTRQVQDGDLVLVDAGGEYEGYGTDITRTFPANGKFTDRQREIYQIVLDAQKAAIDAVKPGASFTNLTSIALHTMAQGLLKAGFVYGDVEDLIAKGVMRVFMPHGLGHFVGVDVHDPGYSTLLGENNVITIEPGIYFNPFTIYASLNNTNLSSYLNKDKMLDYVNFGGVRIEDTLVINSNGAKSLSNVPKEVDQVEEWMKSRSRNSEAIFRSL
jgi:Xaa-Pro dipeptidase